MPTKQKPLDFEKSLEKLETIVEAMENGDLELEQSLKQFEEGIKLIRSCQTSLKTAEQKIQILTENESA